MQNSEKCLSASELLSLPKEKLVSLLVFTRNQLHIEREHNKRLAEKVGTLLAVEQRQHFLEEINKTLSEQNAKLQTCIASTSQESARESPSSGSWPPTPDVHVIQKVRRIERALSSGTELPDKQQKDPPQTPRPLAENLQLKHTEKEAAPAREKTAMPERKTEGEKNGTSPSTKISANSQRESTTRPGASAHPAATILRDTLAQFDASATLKERESSHRAPLPEKQATSKVKQKRTNKQPLQAFQQPKGTESKQRSSRKKRSNDSPPSSVDKKSRRAKGAVPASSNNHLAPHKSQTKKRAISPSTSSRLNTQQRLAVHAPIDRPLIVSAGPGTGKTLMLCHRIKHLLDNGIPPHKILALTHTTAAAEELKNRVRSMPLKKALSKDDIQHIRCCTLHSFCNRVIRAQGKHVGRPISYGASASATLTNNASRSSKNPSHRGDPYWSFITDTTQRHKIVSECLEEAKEKHDIRPGRGDASQTVEYFACLIERHKVARTDPSSLVDIEAEVLRLYQQKMKDRRLMDFQDMLLVTLRVFNDSKLLAVYRNQFEYILVDEFQDSNPLQIELIEKLSAHTGQLTVVGDADQSIYSFRGCIPKCLENLASNKRFPQKAKHVRLKQNYRNSGHIMHLSNSLIEENGPTMPKRVPQCTREDGNPIHVVQCATDTEQLTFVVYAIRHLLKGTFKLDQLQPVNTDDIDTPRSSTLCKDDQREDRRLRPSDIAVLHRVKKHARETHAFLENCGIASHLSCGDASSSPLQRSRKAGLDAILAYLRLSISNTDDESFKKALNKPARGLGHKVSAFLETQAQRNKCSMYLAAKAYVRHSKHRKCSNRAKETAAEVTEGPDGSGFRQTKLQVQHKQPIGYKQRDNLLAFMRTLQELRRSANKASITEMLDMVWHKAGFASLAASTPATKQPQQHQSRKEMACSPSKGARLPQYVRMLREFAQEFTKTHWKEPTTKTKDTRKRFLNAFINDVEYCKKEQLLGSNEGNMVQVTTVHQAKGLEWPAVFLLHCSEDTMPHRLAEGHSDEGTTLNTVEEERRLFYVAMTRAKDHLILCHAEEDTLGMYKEQSRFLTELESHQLGEEQLMHTRGAAAISALSIVSENNKTGLQQLLGRCSDTRDTSDGNPVRTATTSARNSNAASRKRLLGAHTKEQQRDKDAAPDSERSSKSSASNDQQTDGDTLKKQSTPPRVQRNEADSPSPSKKLRVSPPAPPGRGSDPEGDCSRNRNENTSTKEDAQLERLGKANSDEKGSTRNLHPGFTSRAVLPPKKPKRKMTIDEQIAQEVVLSGIKPISAYFMPRKKGNKELEKTTKQT